MLFGASVSTDNPRGVSSRFLSNVWALFALVFLASYTANLAAFMITKDEYYNLSGIKDWRVWSCFPFSQNKNLFWLPQKGRGLKLTVYHCWCNITPEENWYMNNKHGTKWIVSILQVKWLALKTVHYYESYVEMSLNEEKIYLKAYRLRYQNGFFINISWQNNLFYFSC